MNRSCSYQPTHVPWRKEFEVSVVGSLDASIEVDSSRCDG